MSTRLKTVDPQLPGLLDGRLNGTRPSVFGNSRDLEQPKVQIPEGFALDERNEADGLTLLRRLETDSFPLCIFDPQYRGVLDRQSTGTRAAASRSAPRCRRWTRRRSSLSSRKSTAR
jgi:hypothetical protein